MCVRGGVGGTAWWTEGSFCPAAFPGNWGKASLNRSLQPNTREVPGGQGWDKERAGSWSPGVAGVPGQGTEGWPVLPTLMNTASQPHSPALSMPYGGSQGDHLAQGPAPHVPLSQKNITLHSPSTGLSQGQAAPDTCLLSQTQPPREGGRPRLIVPTRPWATQWHHLISYL